MTDINHTEVDNTIVARRSIRAFLPKGVDEALIREILSVSRRAPSGTNTQPWQVYVVRGALKEEISEEVKKAYHGVVSGEIPTDTYTEYYDYYPKEWVSPYKDRRRQNGISLYGLLGLTKDDKEGMLKQHCKNYDFFGAPVALFITTNKIMGNGAKIDIGMFMQNILLSAKSHSLDTCAQAAFNEFWKIVLPKIGASEDEVLIGTISLGYADQEDISYKFETVREDVDTFTKWL